MKSVTQITFNKAMTDQLSNLDKTRIRMVKHPASQAVLVQFTLDKSYQRMRSYTSRSGYSIQVTKARLDRLGLEPGRYHLIPIKRDENNWFYLKSLQFYEPHIRFQSPVLTINKINDKKLTKEVNIV